MSSTTTKLDTLIKWPEHKDKVLNFLKSLDDKDYWFTIKRYRKQRSTSANSYYWVGIVKPICEFHSWNPDIKEDRDKTHEMLKKQFNSEEISITRTLFKATDNSLWEFKPVMDYLEAKEWINLTVQDGCVLFPLHIVRDIPDRFEYGYEVEINDIVTVNRSTTANDTVEFYEMCERIRDYYALEHNLYIPDPKKDNSPMSEFDEIYTKL